MRACRRSNEASGKTGLGRPAKTSKEAIARLVDDFCNNIGPNAKWQITRLMSASGGKAAYHIALE